MKTGNAIAIVILSLIQIGQAAAQDVRLDIRVLEVPIEKGHAAEMPEDGPPNAAVLAGVSIRAEPAKSFAVQSQLGDDSIGAQGRLEVVADQRVRVNVTLEATLQRGTIKVSSTVEGAPGEERIIAGMDGGGRRMLAVLKIEKVDIRAPGPERE